MLDINHITTQSDNVKIFYTQGATAWQAWQKPRNCKFIWMMCIGAGAGGGGGPVGDYGAGAGGSGAVVKALFPANILPDTLFVQPGLGGNGGGGVATQSWSSGAGGGRSFVSLVPSSAAAMNIVCISGATSAASNSSNVGGAGEIVPTVANAGLLSLGNFSATAGQSGASNNGSITPLVATITSGGAGGGTAAFSVAGGDISSVNLGTYSTPTLSGGPATGGVAGTFGIVNWKPMYFLGGAGGGGGTTNGGNGGNGAYGCGGGGGGGAATAVNGGILGGNGGRGGDGLVIIATF